MRCDYCPLSSPEDVCPEAEGKYGIEHKDGAGYGNRDDFIPGRNAAGACNL